MIPVKLDAFRANSFEVIGIFVNFKRRPAVILDFEKLHFDPRIMSGVPRRSFG
jgi:hypothetical protein